MSDAFVDRDFLQKKLEAAMIRVEAAESLILTLRKVLVQVPRGVGDHTDFCRMNHNGLPPMDGDSCCCHVGLVCRALVDAKSYIFSNISV